MLPSLAVQVNGQGTVSADNYNTFEQTCNVAADLRNFVGIDGIQVSMRGIESPNDGGQGTFYWNSSAITPVDDNVNTIVPYSSATGCWSRLVPESSTSIIIQCTALGTNAIGLTPVNPPLNITSYKTLQQYGFFSVGTSTGNVTINYNGLGSKNAYQNDGITQISSGSIISGAFYTFIYQSSLNSGAGGFQLVSSAASTSSGTVASGTANQLAYYATNGSTITGTNAIPNGTTATTQTPSDNSTKVATTAYVDTFPKCRMFVSFDGTSGSPTPSGSFNVSSITKNGAGDYTINFTNNLTSANYSVSGQSGNSSAFGFWATSPAIGSIRLKTPNTGTGTLTDSPYVTASVFL
jgi:hypothetical protein